MSLQAKPRASEHSEDVPMPLAKSLYCDDTITALLSTICSHNEVRKSPKVSAALVQFMCVFITRLSQVQLIVR